MSRRRSSIRISRSSWLNGRWRRCWQVAVALVWLVAIATLIETAIDPSALAFAGAVCGVGLGVLSRRYLPEIDEPTDWFGLRYVPDVQTIARRDSRSAAQGALVVLACAAALALAIILVPLLDPLPESLMMGFLAVALMPSFTRSRRPRAPQDDSAAPSPARTDLP